LSAGQLVPAGSRMPGTGSWHTIPCLIPGQFSGRHYIVLIYNLMVLITYR